VYPQAPAGLVFSGDSAQDPYARPFTASIGRRFTALGIVWGSQGDGSRPFAPRYLMHDTASCSHPPSGDTNSPYVSSLTLSSGQRSPNPFGSYVSNAALTGRPVSPANVVFPAAAPTSSVPTPDVSPTYVMQLESPASCASSPADCAR